MIKKDKPMSTDEFNRALATLEWDYKLAAERLGVTPRHVNRLMAGKSKIPHLISEHLKLLLKKH
jgi:plasmid maintenance system antidote protein VapI